MNWMETTPSGPHALATRPRAVAYYRHSAQRCQENSIQVQRDQVRAWAGKHGFEIIGEFIDAGESAALDEDRPAFTALLEQWVIERGDFAYILCFDASRWGRFQGRGLAAQSLADCAQHGKQIIFTTTESLGEGTRP